MTAKREPDPEVTRIKTTGAAGPFLRYRIAMRRAGFHYGYQYRRTLEAARRFIDKYILERRRTGFDPADITIYGSKVPTFERNPRWEMVEVRENLLFGDS